MDLLVKLMKKQRYNQTTLAQEIGVSRQAVNNWINGTTKPSINNIRLIAKVLKCREQKLIKIFYL